MRLFLRRFIQEFKFIVAGSIILSLVANTMYIDEMEGSVVKEVITSSIYTLQVVIFMVSMLYALIRFLYLINSKQELFISQGKGKRITKYFSHLLYLIFYNIIIDSISLFILLISNTVIFNEIYIYILFKYLLILVGFYIYAVSRNNKNMLIVIPTSLIIFLFGITYFDSNLNIHITNTSIRYTLIVLLVLFALLNLYIYKLRIKLANSKLDFIMLFIQATLILTLGYYRTFIVDNYANNSFFNTSYSTAIFWFYVIYIIIVKIVRKKIFTLKNILGLLILPFIIAVLINTVFVPDNFNEKDYILGDANQEFRENTIYISSLYGSYDSFSLPNDKSLSQSIIDGLKSSKLYEIKQYKIYYDQSLEYNERVLYVKYNGNILLIAIDGKELMKVLKNNGIVLERQLVYSDSINTENIRYSILSSNKINEDEQKKKFMLLQQVERSNELLRTDVNFMSVKQLSKKYQGLSEEDNDLYSYNAYIYYIIKDTKNNKLGTFKDIMNMSDFLESEGD